jgi:hypothetical protein
MVVLPQNIDSTTGISQIPGPVGRSTAPAASGTATVPAWLDWKPVACARAQSARAATAEKTATGG